MSDLTENLLEEIAQVRQALTETQAELHAVCDERDRARRDREGLRTFLEAERTAHTDTKLQMEARLAEARAEKGRIVAAVGAVLAAHGCGCDCGHDSEGHDIDCEDERCLACRVEAALTAQPLTR